MSHLKIAVMAVLGASLPHYATAGSAGLDLKANLRTPRENDPESFDIYELTLKPGERKLIPTGLKMAIPEGYEGQIRPRSGIAKKNKVTVLNAPGTIDSDYRGEVGVLLINHGDNDFVISDGEKIAQMVFAKVERIEWEAVESLGDTDRGEGGFGSTDVASAETADNAGHFAANGVGTGAVEDHSENRPEDEAPIHESAMNNEDADADDSDESTDKAGI